MGTSLSIRDLEEFIENNQFLTGLDEHAIKACLLYILTHGFLGKELKDKITKEWLWVRELKDKITKEWMWGRENLDEWNMYNRI